MKKMGDIDKNFIKFLSRILSLSSSVILLFCPFPLFFFTNFSLISVVHYNCVKNPDETDKKKEDIDGLVMILKMKMEFVDFEDAEWDRVLFLFLINVYNFFVFNL
ncbi:hypothetical protein Ddye_025486 [Dipteronia dyeriana]|uniref:Transmembrane protein n=1 Tax=Dipteronia dyeriana TaxID=168575 RepID=A0AAD9TKG9_9ROSI|nr:hypothetical protein Ddye_025486 [Dipteronia dyeriana]